MTTLNQTDSPPRLRRSLLRLWLPYLNVAVLKRSLLLTLVIGSMLTLVTQSSALFSDATIERMPLLLAFLTPFVVITISQLGATHQAANDALRGKTFTANTPFVTTLVAHTIPLRALAIAVIIGSTISLLILISTIYQTGDITNTPVSLLIQVYVLPFVFGALSQALTYRRCVASTVY